MAKPLSPAQREEYAHRAWRLSLRGKTARQIGEEFGVSEKTVDSLLKRERQKVAAALNPERIAHVAQFEGEQDAVIEDAWNRLDQMVAQERTAPDLQGNVLAASVNKAKARGLFVERSEQTINLTIVSEIEKLLDRPVPVYVVPDPAHNPDGAGES